MKGFHTSPGGFESAKALTTSSGDRPVRLGARVPWPRLFMLVLTQLAGGMQLVLIVLLACDVGLLAVPFKAAAGVLLAGVVAGILHLHQSWNGPGITRADCSWTRCEISAFVTCLILSVWLTQNPGHWMLAGAAAVSALAGIVCSAMACVRAPCPMWPAHLVFGKFFGTTLLLGVTAVAVWSGWFAPTLAPWLASIATVIRTALFFWERALMRTGADPESPRYNGTRLMRERLRPALQARTLLFAASTTFSLMAIFNLSQHGAIWGTIACTTTFTSQGIERYLFFASSVGLSAE